MGSHTGDRANNNPSTMAPNKSTMSARKRKVEESPRPESEPTPRVDSPSEPEPEPLAPQTDRPATKTKRGGKRRKTEPTPPDVLEEEESVVSSVAPSVVSTASVVKKTRKNKKKTNQLSTRTPSSYVLFSMDYRKTVMNDHPDFSLGDVSRMCGAKWKELSDADKNPYIAKAGTLKSERMAIIEEMKKDEPVKKKRTPSSYLLFAMEHRKKVLANSPSFSIGEVSKECGAAWKELSEDDRKTWKTKADELKAANA